MDETHARKRDATPVLYLAEFWWKLFHFVPFFRISLKSQVETEQPEEVSMRERESEKKLVETSENSNKSIKNSMSNSNKLNIYKENK